MAEIVAFLQNQWFKNPEGVKQVFARYPDQRRDLLSTFLFMGCLTGRRLKAAFGEDLCKQIVWEEASREVGGQSSSVFPADPEHIRSTIEELRPRIVLTFGKVALSGVMAALPLVRGDIQILIIGGPHPAARHATVNDELMDMAARVQKEVPMSDSASRHHDHAPGYSWQVLDCAPHEVAEAIRREEAKDAREREGNLARARAFVAARRARR